MALLQSDTARIGHTSGKPAEDRVSDERVFGTPRELREALSKLIGGDQVLHRAIDLVRYASDASPYRLIPQVVVTPRTTGEVVALLKYCRENGRHATFRAAGTSLCGQAQSDDILIDVRKHWYGMSLADGGSALRARPGVILGHASAFLRKHGRRLGPDPASINACTIGGVIANNSGGMRCKVEHNAYHMVRSMTLALASGTVIDTAQPDAEAAFMRSEPDLAQGLLKLRAELIADRPLTDRVRHKFMIRNTNGYRLDALLDADTPLEIFRRLVVGSEGTLAFIAEAVIDTLSTPGATCVTWIALPSMNEAIALVPSLVSLGAEAVELMMAPALTAAAQAFPGTPHYWMTLDPKAAALLVEFTAADDAALDQIEAAARVLLANANLLQPLEFTRDAKAMEIDWRVREGLIGIIGKGRPEGSALVNEDVCFPPARIAEGAQDLQALLTKHGFLPGVAGHAAFGNLHFTLTPRLDDPADRGRYSAFMDDLVELVIDKYDGSLKAEHGTGRNMAPFVRREWGDKAIEMMWRIKGLADPYGVLAPDCALSRDEGIHLQRFKSSPAIDGSEATRCIECGMCEPVCPSRNVTMTPRQRIVVRREMARQPSDSQMFAQLLKEYEYDGIQTCAADGTCAEPCPVSINTGTLIKSFRQRENSDGREKVALAIAKRWRSVETIARIGIGVTDFITRTVGVRALTGLTTLARAVLSKDLIPSVPGPMPQKAPRRLPQTSRQGASAVYFPACINRIFGRARGMARRPSLPEALVALSARAGKPLWIPDNVRGLCCSTPWSSKGYRLGHEWMATAIADAMWDWSNAGALPIVIDAVSCTHGLLDDVRTHIDRERQGRFNKIELVDAIDWVHRLLPSLPVERKLASAAVHPTCSMIHLGLEEKFIEIARAVADDVIVPIGTTCCGTAGDRGLLHPELVVSATREEKAYLDAHPADVYLSANRTCEMGLQQATGKPYESFIFTLEETTRPDGRSRIAARGSLEGQRLLAPRDTSSFSSGEFVMNADLSMIQHHRADLDGLRMHFVEAGKGPAVILLHGFPETWYAWRYQIAPLAQHYRLIVPDLRGYGATDKPASGYDKRTMANDIRRLMQHLNIQKASIIGHDRGARVGTRFVKDHPEAVVRFAALDNIPTKVVFDSMNAAFAQFGWFFLFHSVPHLPEALVQGREEMWLRYIFRNWTYNPEALSDADIAIYTQAYAQPGGLHGAFSDYSAWRQDLEQDYADADKRIACPTLALWGAEFAGAKIMDMAKLWDDMASDLKVAPILLSGHLPHEEQPEQVTAALLDFLQA